MRSAARSQRGVTLVEAAIVLLVAAGITVTAAVLMRSMSQQAQRESVQASQAHVLNTVYLAATRYVATRVDAIADATTELPITNLEAAELLTTGWEGRYAPGPRLTPLGQRYAVYINRDAANEAVAVTVVTLGAPQARQRAKYGIADDRSLRAWQQALARTYRVRYAEEVWLLDPPETTGGPLQVRPLSLGGVAKESVTASQDQLPTPPAAAVDRATLAISSRWSDRVKVTGQFNGISVSDPTTCEVVLSGSSSTAATCPSGKERVALLPWHNCRYREPVAAVSSPAGLVAVSTEEFYASPDSVRCGRQCDPSVIPGCSAGTTGAGSGMATPTNSGGWTCPRQAYSPDAAQALKLLRSNGEAGFYRVEANGGYVPQFYDRELLTIFRIDSREVGREWCLGDRWVSPGASGWPSLNANTLNAGATNGAPPAVNALCCRVDR